MGKDDIAMLAAVGWVIVIFLLGFIAVESLTRESTPTYSEGYCTSQCKNPVFSILDKHCACISDGGWTRHKIVFPK